MIEPSKLLQEVNNIIRKTKNIENLKEFNLIMNNYNKLNNIPYDIFEIQTFVNKNSRNKNNKNTLKNITNFKSNTIEQLNLLFDYNKEIYINICLFFSKKQNLYSHLIN